MSYSQVSIAVVDLHSEDVNKKMWLDIVVKVKTQKDKDFCWTTTTSKEAHTATWHHYAA